MTAQTFTADELTADAKQVYKGNLLDVIALAEKYNVTTNTLTFYRDDRGLIGRDLVVAAFGSKGSDREIRSKLYATIKGQMR